MARMNHVMQIGIVEGKFRFYLEDYVYTYLKKQEGAEKRKYYLYGEQEKKEGESKIYIYGISDSTKEEHTYFKDYSFLGFLKIKGEEKRWVSLSGQEILLKGFFVFYAPNQAMQEYLVDTSKQKNEADKSAPKTERKLLRDNPPIKETLVPARKQSYNKMKDNSSFNRLIVPVGCLAMVLLLVMTSASSTENSRLQALKQIVVQTLGIGIEDTSEELIVEEKRADEQDNIAVETMNLEGEAAGDIMPDEATSTEEATPDETASAEEVIPDKAASAEEATPDKAASAEEATPDETIFATENQQTPMQNPDTSQNTAEGQASADTADTAQSEPEYEEYIVQEGDTLAAICENQYGSQLKMQEICRLNEIKNADYIAPGQKLYLPK